MTPDNMQAFQNLLHNLTQQARTAKANKEKIQAMNEAWTNMYQKIHAVQDAIKASQRIPYSQDSQVS